MNIGILILLSSCVVSIKIFSFDPGVDEKLAKVLLEKSREEVLPERFIVCFAMRQNNIDGRSPFLITDKKKQPWLALSIWDVGNQLALWAEIGKKDWKLFHTLKVPWKFWYDEELGRWQALHQKHKDFLATSAADKNSLLIGSHEWKVENDSKTCPGAGSYSTVLKLTGCSEEEFTCDDGSCVPMTNRCDAKKDCADGTDEAECKTFVRAIGYNRFITPPPVGNDTRPKMFLSITIDEIVEINEKDGFFRCQVWMERKWIDRRLTFQNLKKESELNEINPEDRDLIWKPWTAYKNIEDRSKYARTDLKQVWKVVPNSNFSFERADTSVLSNTYFFDGASNMISYEIGYTTEWLCDFHMAWYPFDSQSCTMKFLQQEDSLVLVPETVKYIGGDLEQHFIRNITMLVAKVVFSGRISQT